MRCANCFTCASLALEAAMRPISTSAMPSMAAFSMNLRSSEDIFVDDPPPLALVEPLDCDEVPLTPPLPEELAPDEPPLPPEPLMPEPLLDDPGFPEVPD